MTSGLDGAHTFFEHGAESGHEVGPWYFGFGAIY
jgi:hypothetical protein